VPQASERPFPISKDLLDTINSVTWFLADGFWLLGYHGVAITCIVPTLLTGLLLLYIEKRPTVVSINCAINCWTWMNALWIVQDWTKVGGYFTAAKFAFGLGIFFVLLAVVISRNVRETFSHFRRFRMPRWK
jgi:hypothetical protein